MRLYSGLPIAELTRTSLTTRGTEEHVEQKDTRKTRNTRTRGTRGIRGHEEYEDTRRSQNEINAMATLHRYKRGHTPRIQKGLSGVEQNKMQFVTRTLTLLRKITLP